MDNTLKVTGVNITGQGANSALRSAVSVPNTANLNAKLSNAKTGTPDRNNPSNWTTLQLDDGTYESVNSVTGERIVGKTTLDIKTQFRAMLKE